MNDDYLTDHQDTLDPDDEVSEFVRRLAALHRHFVELQQAEDELMRFLDVPAQS